MFWNKLIATMSITNLMFAAGLFMSIAAVAYFFWTLPELKGALK